MRSSHANDKDVLFVAAAGNDGTNNDNLPTWPASYPFPNVDLRDGQQPP